MNYIRYSIVVPVYGNEQSIPGVLSRLAGLASELPGGREAAFVVDGRRMGLRLYSATRSRGPARAELKRKSTHAVRSFVELVRSCA